jgi:hypothetical protein
MTTDVHHVERRRGTRAVAVDVRIVGLLAGLFLLIL